MIYVLKRVFLNTIFCRHFTSWFCHCRQSHGSLLPGIGRQRQGKQVRDVVGVTTDELLHLPHHHIGLTVKL